MKAKRIDGNTPGGNRSLLSKAIPLSTPYMIQIFPVYGCNFRCNYCIHSVPQKTRGFISDETYMDFKLYKKCIDDLKSFSNKIKMLRFAGTGEPLLHNDIAKMVQYAVENQVATSIDIVSNGVLLTPDLSQKLIDAGLSRLRISVQGINAGSYKNVSKVDLNFEKFIENLTYFYEHKGKTQIYIKIIDSALKEGDEKKFFDIFGDICDEIAIEHLLPAVSQIDYTDLAKGESIKKTQNGVKVQDVEVCPQPFYLMQINPEGNIIPCCAMETSYIVDNCKNLSLYDIWNSESFDSFRRMQLRRNKSKNPTCAKCQHYKYSMFPEDILDHDAERLLDIFTEDN